MLEENFDDYVEHFAKCMTTSAQQRDFAFCLRNVKAIPNGLQPAMSSAFPCSKATRPVPLGSIRMQLVQGEST
jgi:hypothetical protein